MSDHDRLADGEHSFVALLARDHTRILGYILTLVPHRHDAEDLFQKVSLLLWEKFGEFEANTDFLAWACRVAFLTVCSHRRTQYRSKLTFHQELLETMARERVEHLKDQGSRLEYLLGCVERLTAEDQSLLMQTYGDDASIREQASRTGKAVQTLYNRLAILRRELMTCVQNKLLAQRA